MIRSCSDLVLQVLILKCLSILFWDCSEPVKNTKPFDLSALLRRLS